MHIYIYIYIWESIYIYIYIYILFFIFIYIFPIHTSRHYLKPTSSSSKDTKCPKQQHNPKTTCFARAFSTSLMPQNTSNLTHFWDKQTQEPLCKANSHHSLNPQTTPKSALFRKPSTLSKHPQSSKTATRPPPPKPQKLSPKFAQKVPRLPP